MVCQLLMYSQPQSCTSYSYLFTLLTLLHFWRGLEKHRGADQPLLDTDLQVRNRQPSHRWPCSGKCSTSSGHDARSSCHGVLANWDSTAERFLRFEPLVSSEQLVACSSTSPASPHFNRTPSLCSLWCQRWMSRDTWLCRGGLPALRAHQSHWVLAKPLVWASYLSGAPWSQGTTSLLRKSTASPGQLFDSLS